MRNSTGAAIGPILSVCAVVAAAAAAVTAESIEVPAIQHEAEGKQQGEQADPLAQFLANYVEWAKGIEAEGQERGTPLTPRELELAAEIGIKHPEKVRLVYVEAVPFPTHDTQMREMGESLGFIGPGIVNNAQAFGYTVWVRDGFVLDWPGLAHELVHVQQIERSASFGEYAGRYIAQLFEFGHSDMPLEVEAYEANRKYAEGSADTAAQ